MTLLVCWQFLSIVLHHLFNFQPKLIHITSVFYLYGVLGLFLEVNN